MMCYSALVKRDLKYLESHYGAVVIREQMTDYLRAAAHDAKRFPPLQDRIYPGHYAPVVHYHNGTMVSELMRYGAYPPASVANPERYTTFNARRDNLHSPFWAEAFMQHHGFVVLNAFYEWVASADLVAAGVVSLPEIAAAFSDLAAQRKAKVEAAGKRYRPTPTELKDVRSRKIIIEFTPYPAADLLVPVIYSRSRLGPGLPDAGFAIVTDEPPPEISLAGHDRCPVVLPKASLPAWLRPEHERSEALLALLSAEKSVKFTHQLPDAV